MRQVMTVVSMTAVCVVTVVVVEREMPGTMVGAAFTTGGRAASGAMGCAWGLVVVRMAVISFIPNL